MIIHSIVFLRLIVSRVISMSVISLDNLSSSFPISRFLPYKRRAEFSAFANYILYRVNAFAVTRTIMNITPAIRNAAARIQNNPASVIRAIVKHRTDSSGQKTTCSSLNFCPKEGIGKAFISPNIASKVSTQATAFIPPSCGFSITQPQTGQTFDNKGNSSPHVGHFIFVVFIKLYTFFLTRISLRMLFFPASSGLEEHC